MKFTGNNQHLAKVFLTALICTCCHIFAIGQQSSPSENGFTVFEDSLQISVSLLNERTAHVQITKRNQPVLHQSLVVGTPKRSFKKYTVNIQKEKTKLQTEALIVEYDHVHKQLIYTDAKTKQVILAEKSGARTFIPFEALGDKGYTTSQTFTLSPAEGIYGLGQFQEGLLNYRGSTVNLVHANREIVNPVLVSTNNYLLYWDNYSKTTFSDNENGMTFKSELGDAIDYYFVYGKNMNDAIVGFRNLTGQAPMLPKSAFGYWMSKERYKSFDELTSVVEEYRKRNLPIDNIVQDWQYWGAEPGKWNSMEFDPTNFNNPKEVIDRLHNKYNVKLTLSIWPAVGKDTKIHQSLDSVGALFNEPTWIGYKVIDIYNPKAREIYWDYLYRGLYTKGVDSWWMDATEPSFKDGLYQDKQEERQKSAGMTHIGSFHRYLNTYSLVFSEAMYKNLRKQSNKRVSILTRSAFAGQQKYGTSTWSGDIYASWDVFRKQIPAGLNFCMTGIPYWTTDIGGFRVISQEKAASGGQGEIGSYVGNAANENDGGYKLGLRDSAYLELYTRWFQYGTFNPMFRAHGTEVPREIWHFGEKGTQYYDAQEKMIRLRYTLLSYLYSSSADVTLNGSTMMRPLVMDFTDDLQVRNNGEGFMLGDALLVYPVIRPMFYNRQGKIANPDTKVSLYMPKHPGNGWYVLDNSVDSPAIWELANKMEIGWHLGTSGKPTPYYRAGETITYDAPLDVIPVFVKAGSIVPRDKVSQYATENDNKEMIVDIYAGQNATYVLYEDDNETYDYEKGRYSTITFSWDENTQTLTISNAKGNFPNKLKERFFLLRLITPDAAPKNVLVKYSNKKQTVKF